MTEPSHSGAGETSLTSLTSLTSATSFSGSAGMSYTPFLELGEGGMAKVYLARATGPAGFVKLVVLKTLRKAALTNPSLRQMFLNEARLSARLHHPNLVQVHELNLKAESPYLVMEYLDGKPLSALRRNPNITLPMWLTLVSEVLSGLHYVHELCDFDGTALHIVHRDVSLHNVFITYDGCVKILDFGIAKTREVEAQTEFGEVKGTLTYMAPEQLLGEEVDRRADVFAVGSILWEAAVGERMWENVQEATLMLRLANGDIPRPRGPIDPELERIILKATTADRRDRYDSALELQRDLDRFIEETGGRGSIRAIGAKVAGLFAEEREKNQDLISRALRTTLPTPAGELAEAEPVPPPRRSHVPIFLAIALSALVALGFVFAPRFRQAPAPEPAAASPAASVAVAVRASPELARIEIDGKDVGQGAVTLRVLADSNDHVLRVSAEGHEPETRSVKFDRDRDLVILLQRQMTPDRTAESAPSSAPAASAAPKSRAQKTPRNAPNPRKEPESGTRPPAPPSEDKCNPPYYFVGGIKTYKPECL